MAKGYAQIYSMDYLETFSLITKITSIHLLISFAASYDWSLHQFDVKNALLHGDLIEVDKQQPPRFVA